MGRMWVVVALSWSLATACSDTIEGDEQPWLVDEEAPGVPTQTEPQREPVVVSLPTAERCVEPSLIGTADLDNTLRAMPAMTESFGADGCVAERWMHEWDEDRPLVEIYDFFDPDIAFQTYAVVEPYTHRWRYDTAGRVVHQERARAGDDTSFLEDTQYDSRGRITMLSRRSNIWSGSFDDSTYREVWTFDGENEEFTTHSATQDHVLQQSTRRQFARGEIVNEWQTVDGRPEKLVLRRELDGDGHIIEEETWDLYDRGSTHAWIERRADGTMLRRTQKNLGLGWLDIWEYDEQERVTLYTQDETEDGSIEYRQITRYDDAGNTVFESTEYDFGRSPTTYSEVTRTFDEQGRLIESLDTPTWLDGDSQRVRNEYDARGDGFTTTATRLDRNGAVIQTTSITRWLAPRQLDWQKTDADRDGKLETLETRLWRGMDPVERLVDTDGDSASDLVEQWHYDAAGQLAEYIMDSDGDGVADSRILHQR